MNFHDAKLLSIELGNDHSAVMKLLEESGQKHNLTIAGLERLRCFDFREGNIILELQVYCGSPPPIAPLRKLFDLQDGIPDFLFKKVQKIHDGELTLLHILPSYGCELLCLCRTASFQNYPS